jgi:phosphoesterase RecJ-like protein
LETFDFSAFKKLLLTPKKILLTSHTNPDGDALGSSLALYHFLKKTGHDVMVMVPDRFPEFLYWMPGQKEIKIFEENKEQYAEHFANCDILVSLDYNAPSRLGKEPAKFFNSSKATKVLIDHHIDPDYNSYDLCYSTTNISSTSEMVFELIEFLSPSNLDEDIASCIYAGIMTDTGSFSYNCNYYSTFEIVAHLYKTGMDGQKINRLVYATNSESRVRLLGYSLSSKLKVVEPYHTAYIALTKKELEEFKYQSGDTEGLVNFALSIKGIKFAALFSERDNKIRISFRSAGDFSVNDFARKHFEGGGHKNAAGGDSFIPMDKTLEKFERLLAEYNNELD